jgi:Flp pilus assembly protein TadG/uncharacterized protein YegL
MTRRLPPKSARYRRRSRRGAMLILIAVCIPILIVMAVFAVDVAYMELVRAELRSATDAAAHAGTRQLSLTQSAAQARTAAKDAASRNMVSGTGLQLADSDIDIGRSVRTGTARYAFTDGGTPSNSVRVTGLRTQSSLSGPINLFFARYLGQSSFEPVHQAIATQMDRDMALVLDQSGSMTGQKWTDLNNAVSAFFAELNGTPQDELVSLETFHDTGQHHHNISSNYAQISSTLSSLTPGGTTAVGEGMQEGIQSLSSTTRLAAKALVVMTDGIHNQGIDPAPVALTAKDAGITVYTVTFGADADQLLMQQVATNGGGKHWHAPTGPDLIAVFQEIANTTPTLLTE